MLDYLAVSGAIYFTGAFAVLLFGLYWKRASRVGAYAALAAGMFALLGLTPVRQGLRLTNAELGLNINEAHIGLAATVTALLLMGLGSWLFPDREQPGAGQVPRPAIRDQDEQ